jgi:DNA-binding winged helix-turn-helix (wHTH) protein
LSNSNAKSNTESNNKPNNAITSPYYIEGFYVDPSQNIILTNNETRNVQPKVMEVLTYLCSKAGQLVPSNELILACWPNQYISDGPVHKCIAQLRKALTDDPKNPLFIKTVPKQGYVFIAKVKGLKVTSHAPRASWTGESPYPGLQPYTFEQSEWFFGREQVITEVNNWVAQINNTDTTWLSLSAPVGKGKSSLVYSGILPALVSHAFITTNKQAFGCVLDLALIPVSQNPHDHLLELLLANEKISPALTVKEYGNLLTKQTINSTNNEQVALFQSYLLAGTGHSRFVLFIDHFEQLFDCYSAPKPNADDHSSFFFLIQLLISSKKCLLITAIREQFLPELALASPEYAQAFHYKIPAFSHTELIDIIEKPAELVGVIFEYNEENRERLSNVIIQQLQVQSVDISSLQYLLAQLYAKKFNQLFTYKAYKKIGGIAGSLSTIAEQNHQKLTAQEQTSFELILFRIITLNTNGQIATSEQPCPINHFTDKHKLSVINKFINVGIFQLTLIDGQTCIYLAHESLLTTWPRINSWLKNNISTLYIRYDLRVAMQRWQYHEKSSHLLIHSDKKIKNIKHIIRYKDFDISADEKVLLALSTSKLIRTNQIKKTIIASFFISFVCLVGLSVTLVEKNQQVTTTRNNAENLVSFILYDLKNKLAPLGKLELLNIVADKTLAYFTLAGIDNLTGKALEQWVESLHILGEVNISKNNYTKTEAYFQQTLNALNHALAKEPTNEKLLELTMLANYWLGYSAFLQLDYKTAKPFWTNYLTYANRLFLHYPRAKWQLEQSYALNNLGALSEKTQQLSAASNYFEQSAEIKLTLLKTQPDNPAIRADLADTLSWQSNIHTKAGKLYLAIDNLQQALVQIERINFTNNSYNNTERLSELEHKIALIYYDAGNLHKSKTYAESAQKRITTLVTNDNKNTLFKEDLLWNYTLLIENIIIQKNLDLTLVYLDKAKKLINQLNNLDAATINTSKANVHILHSQARTMALLNQPQSALVTIVEADKLLKKHFSIETETALYARIVLTHLVILNDAKKAEKVTIQNDLIALISLLEAKLQSSSLDYQVLSIYITAVKFAQQLQPDKHIQLNNQWLQLYQQSDYNIPEHSIISSMDSNEYS